MHSTEDSRTTGDFPAPIALKEMGDGELVRLLTRGYSEAMTVVFDRYYAPMMRLALRILRNRAEAEDAVQIAFADFYRKIQLFDDGKGSLRNWLLQYVYGRCINRIKAQKVRHHAAHIELSEAAPAELAASRESVLDLNEPEAKRFAQQILGKLKGKKRWIVELVCLDGMTIREVAALIREPHSRVQNRYYRAIAELRDMVKEAEGLSIFSAESVSMMEIDARKFSGTLKGDHSEVKVG